MGYPVCLEVTISCAEDFILYANERTISWWINMCVLRWLALVQEKLHSLQAKGFSPLWTSMCAFKLAVVLLEFPHWLQCGIFSKWGYLGKVKLLDWSKVYFVPLFQPQVGVFFACDISSRVEKRLKSCSDNIWNTLLPGLQFPDVSI